MKLGTKGLGALAALLPLVAAPVAGAAVPPCPEGQQCLAGVPVDSLATPAEVVIVHPINGWVQQITGYPAPRPAFLCDGTNNECQNITWPFPWIPDGVTAFDAAIDASTGEVIVFAYSQGTQIAQQWLKAHLFDPTIPGPEDLTFVLLGNSTRPYGGSLNFLGAIGDVWPPSDYTVVDVARQYEYSADYPNNPLSPYYSLALANALAGGWYLHDYAPVSTPEVINSDANTVWKVGNTTYVLIPTENLPLLEPLRAFGLSALADSLNGQLKPLVDTAYYRNYPNVSQAGTILSTQDADSALAAPEAVPNLFANTETITTGDPSSQDSQRSINQLSVNQIDSTGPTDLVADEVPKVDDTENAIPPADDPSATTPTDVTEVDTNVDIEVDSNVNNDVDNKADPVPPGPKHRKPGGTLADVKKSFEDVIRNFTGRGRGSTSNGDTGQNTNQSNDTPKDDSNKPDEAKQGAEAGEGADE